MEKKFVLLRQRKLLERLDVMPFVFIYGILLAMHYSMELNFIVQMSCFVVTVITQFVVFFCKFWSEKSRAIICFQLVNNINQANYVRTDFIHSDFKANNRSEISKISKTKESIIIEVDKINYIYDENKKTFLKAKFELNKKLREFLDAEPYNNNSLVEQTQEKFGKNLMNIPIPSFIDLYKEHVVAPFFVFQIFCIMLWIFDDYGIHSFTTLTMLCIFEATVVGQRIMNLVALRKMRNPPHYIKVYRNNTWTKISSEELIPGDIVSIIDGTNLDAAEETKSKEEENFFMKLLSKLKEMKKKAEEKRGLKSVNTSIAKNKEKEGVPLTCDLILISGSAIVNESMLTGESIPQIKESISRMDEKEDFIYDPKVMHKSCTLFAGTTVVKGCRDESDDILPKYVKEGPPDKGCICMVTKIGFNTSQGKLLRTVMFTSDKNQGESLEAFIFIFFLLAIAIYAAYIVLLEGIEREGEITYKLLLRCIIIITSVVPAELPIELSLAINNSLLFLQGKKIMCIEPFRIPFAGKIDICCFDKTGTLTKDEFLMKGVVCPTSNNVISAQEVDETTSSILLGCNSLLSIGGKVVGDPIELVVFKSAGGSLINNMINSKTGLKIFVERRYAFDASLKRMSVLCKVYSSVYKNVTYKRVLSKGAPEVMKSLFSNIPDNYDEIANKFAKKGFRILAIGYKDDESLNVSSHRDEVEKNLTYAGLLITETPLKSDTPKYINELLNADLNCIIITGDHHLTTAKIAVDLNIGPHTVLFGKITYKSQEKKCCIEWFDLDKKLIKETKCLNEVIELSSEYMLGLVGEEVLKLEDIKDSDLPEKSKIFKHIKLYCRVAPLQKDMIVRELIKAGCNPSMCGDGSNDVGALKRALIGVALLNSEDLAKTDKSKEQPFSILSLDDDTNIKSGDVTAAAPFTSKSGSIKCMKNIFIRGRCTLVITFQMFKILALNCLMTAYCMSILALKGVKFSDYQSTYIGFLVAFCFLMLSRGEPLKKLNKNYPQFTIFTVASIISIVGQAVTHLISLQLIIYITELSDPVAIGKVKSLEDPFSPTLMNTVVFLYTAINNVTNFLVNYIGEPFMENITKNIWMQRLCWGVWGVVIVLIFELHSDLNEYFELLPLADDLYFRLSIIGILAADLVICYVFENWKKIFRLYK
jgi:cation-transporting ATPase 13A1